MKHLLDRRTVVTFFVTSLLFILAFRNQEAKTAIEGIVTVAITLVGANAIQHSVTAFSKNQDLPTGETK